MDSNEAKKLVREYHSEQADLELSQTLSQISDSAKVGKTSYFTFFNYESNVQRLVDRGFDVNVRSKTHNESEEKYVTYYDITWREDV